MMKVPPPLVPASLVDCATVAVPTASAPAGRSAGAPPDAWGRSQLSLRGLFLATTYFAVAALLVSFWIGLFVALMGICLTWLSFRGYLWWLQTKAARPRVFGGAWLLFAASLALPVVTIHGCSNQAKAPLGWEVAYGQAVSIKEPAPEAAAWMSESSSRSALELAKVAGEAVMVLIYNLPNLMVLASPWLLIRQQRGRGAWGTACLGCAAVSTWYWSVLLWPVLRIGYYVWAAAVMLLFLARRPSWPALAAMTLTGAAMAAIVWLSNVWS
jgi:hypothetical protein